MTPPLPLKKRADRVPGAFLLGSAHICWLTPHHRAALKPSEEAEALAPSVFNGRWLGHEKADAGGSGLTFLREHHKNCSNKALIMTFTFKQTPPRLSSTERLQTSLLDTLSPLLSHFWGVQTTPPKTYSIYYRFLFWLYSFSLFIFTQRNNCQQLHLPCCSRDNVGWTLHRVMDHEDRLRIVQKVRTWHLLYCRNSQCNMHFITYTAL